MARTVNTNAIAVIAYISLLISWNVDPLSITILLIRMIYTTGFTRFNFCAHTGILSRGVKMPLISTKMIMKKNPVNMNCCCVLEKVDTNRARPRIATMKMAEQRKRRAMLPSNGMLKVGFPMISPKARSVSPIIKKGTILAAMK